MKKIIRNMLKIPKAICGIFAIFWDMLKEVFRIIGHTLTSNLYVIGALIEFSTPYIMWYIANKGPGYAEWKMLFVPVAFFLLGGMLKRISNDAGTGLEIPVAKKRFTKEQGYGEITISEDDLQEIILYLNDVENYIEKRGLDKWE